MKMREIVECQVCNGTGILTTGNKTPGEAIQCELCTGTGCTVIHYTKFKGRKDVEGITRVLVRDKDNENNIIPSFKPLSYDAWKKST